MDDIVKQITVTATGMWKFRWPGLVAAWVAAAVAVAVVFRIPDQYEATARVFVDTESILKPLMRGLAVQPNVEQQVGMLSRTLISRPNIDKLIRMADLDLKSEGAGDREALADKLMKSIEVRTTGGPNLYSLAYRDKEREKAKRVVQSLVSIFVESGIGAARKDTDSAKSFLANQIKTFESKLEEAEARLKEFRLRNLDRQVVDGRDSATRLSETHTQLEAARLQLREAQQARDSAKRLLAEARGQAPNPSALPDLLAWKGNESDSTTALIATPEIDLRIEAQKRNLDGLLQRYTDRHPDVVSTRRLISDLEEQRRHEVAELRRRAASQPKPVAGSAGEQREGLAVQELNRMLATAEVQVASIQARVDEFGSRYAQLRESLKTAPQIEAEAAQLNRDYEITRRNYQDLVARRQSAEMSGELDAASGVAEFRLVDPPRVSSTPVSPNRLMLLPLALVAALAVGLFFSFAASRLRPSFFDAEELRVKTGLPLLGVVSLVQSDGERRQERLGLVRFASATSALVGLFVAGIIMLYLMGRTAV
jgi:polysaccharide chain length determinant protein (PEP-CTERM system associated)